MENNKLKGKFFIIKDIKFSDFMKYENGEIIIYDSFENASTVCGMYEFKDALICEVKHNYIEQ